eukprot:1140123-Pelagomonas_calceolata.AAC.4
MPCFLLHTQDLERQMDALKLGLEEIRASTSIDESAGARKGKEPTDAGTATSTTGSKDSAAAGSGDAHWQQGEDGDKSVGRNFSFRWGLPHATRWGQRKVCKALVGCS